MRNDSRPNQPDRRVVPRSAGGPRFNTTVPWHADNRASYVVAARELDGFRLGDDRIDVRSWPVFAADGVLVGAVDRLMIEPLTQRVRYVAVSLLADADREWHPSILGSVLVPVGLVQRRDDRQMLQIDGLTSEQLANAPRLLSRAVMRADEDATLAAFGLPNSSEVPAADFYKGPRFDEQSLRSASKANEHTS